MQCFKAILIRFQNSGLVGNKLGPHVCKIASFRNIFLPEDYVGNVVRWSRIKEICS